MIINILTNRSIYLNRFQHGREAASLDHWSTPLTARSRGAAALKLERFLFRPPSTAESVCQTRWSDMFLHLLWFFLREVQALFRSKRSNHHLSQLSPRLYFSTRYILLFVIQPIFLSGENRLLLGVARRGTKTEKKHIVGQKEEKRDR